MPGGVLFWIPICLGSHAQRDNCGCVGMSVKGKGEKVILCGW